MFPLTPATPSPTPTPGFDISQTGQAVAKACQKSEGVLCTILNTSFPEKDLPVWVPLVAGVADVLLVLALILGGALIVRGVAHRLITRVTLRASVGVLPERLRAKTLLVTDATSAILTERRRQRAETMGSVLRSLASVVILGTAALMILARLGVELAPLLTSVGIIGVAVGFGAQELVKDFIAGMFMLLEDQYGVGDVIDTGMASGTVEAVTLRITRLRDADGKVWYVRNGTITRVGNESQGWSRALVDVPVPYAADISTIRDLLKDIATELWDDPDYRDTVIVEEPQVYGLEQISGTAVIFRVSVKTAPAKNMEVARELRLRIKRAFDDKGLAFAAVA
ncbi:mechanosensitive ion channel family protein [Planotetraspora sp. A-T 1434]|uniref:mechanosensitive ion channel family protein n=1 Tax=Planotetraspora sp. A-T 1434 TaxID=2979219 RepID=UPI0021C21A28|nr:mechanosensitive ion channel family protein [Planotetraspora sp. A-T 1434]MCT9933847.1 mechanosensitive ion channel family protein [Planotetraspora sp. A-T 1434]